jgi:tetratricopeptide (TPR) repeat protein
VNRLARTAIALVAAGFAADGGRASAQDVSVPGRILVMPFENVTREARIFWLSEASAVLLSDDLAALGSNPIARPERQDAFERLQVPPAATLSDATVIRIGQLVGADRVVLGTLQLEGDALVVHARSIELEAGKVQADVTERGPLPDLYATFERVARKIAPASGRTSDEVERQHPPVAAFENYIKGVLAATPETAIGFLNAALALQPGFDRARLALWDTYTDEGEYDLALAAVRPVAAASPLGRRARFLAGLSLIELKRYDDAFTTFKTLADARPDAAVLNNLGVVQVRRGSTPQSGLATYFFNKAAEADPEDADYEFNLGYAYWLEHDAQAAAYWLREAVRRRPADGEAHYVLGVALSSVGSTAEAAREKELARRLSSSFAQWEKRPAADPIPKGLERIKTQIELLHARRLDATIAHTEQKDQQELARFYLDSGRRLYDRENDREAVAELNRALYLSPYLAEAHLLLGRIHLRNGRTAEAIDAFKISIWSEDKAAAHAALGEAYRLNKDAAAARAEAERALALDPASADAKALLARLDAR